MSLPVKYVSILNCPKLSLNMENDKYGIDEA
jgi:hypothetical protein